MDQRLAFTQHAQRVTAYIVVAVLVGLFVCALVYTVSRVQSTTTNTNRTAHAVLDCTRTSGHCYRRNERATARVVKQIVDQSAAAAAAAASCAADGLTEYRPLLRCVRHRLRP